MPSAKDVSLKKLCLYCANKIKMKEISAILHTALEFKAHKHNLKLPDLQHKSVTVLLRRPKEILQMPLYSAGHFLNINIDTITSKLWDRRAHMIDTRRFLEQHTDFLMVDSKYLTKSKAMIDGSPIPIVFMKTCQNNMIPAMAELMTIYEHFGRLNELNMVWIGPPCPLLNSLMAFCPKFGIKFDYTCGLNLQAPVSPSSLYDVKNQCKLDQLTFNFTENTMEEICKTSKHAHIIHTAFNDGETMEIIQKVVKDANENSIVFHTKTRGTEDSEENLFNCKQCRVWELTRNMKWIFAALMVRLLVDYEHHTKAPIFIKKKAKNKL